MGVKGYRIISLEANEIYEQELQNGENIGYILPKEKSFKYFKLFKNVLDDSLDLRELKEAFKRKRDKVVIATDDYKNEYSLAIVNVEFNYAYKKNEKKEKGCKELREHFYQKGFYLGGVHYVRYKRSSGSSRQGKCLFINEKYLKSMSKWGECGLKLTKDSDLASWESYKSLSLSSLKGTIDIPLNGILFIPDYKSEFKEEAVSVEEEGGSLVANTKETKVKNDIWDGESLLDESLFTGDYEKNHMMLLRNKFFKSCAFKTKLQKWFKDKNITLEDLKARGFITLATDISQIVMVTTPNSMKFLKFMNDELTEDNVRKWMDKVDSTFGVVKYDKRTKFFDGKMVQSSYQLINTLGLSEEHAEELLKPSIEYLTTIRNDYDFMCYHFDKANKREEDDEEDEKEELSDGLAERSKVIFKLMHINYGFKDTRLYYNFRDDVVKSQKDKLKQGHILLPGTNATLFGNGPEMLLALSGEFNIKESNNSSYALEKAEIACQGFKNGERLVCARSPHITMGNIYCAVNNLSSSIWNYFDLGENIVCVNAIGENIQQRLNGCDYDSDAMLITNDQLIVETAFKYKDKFGVPVCKIESSGNKNSTLWDLDYDTSENKIGDIVNLSQKLNSILWDKLNSGCEYESIQGIYEDICKLAVLSGIEIDKAKRAYDNIDATKELKELYSHYGKTRPAFFKEMDEGEIERQVRTIKDENEAKQRKLREEKRKELWAKKEYAFYNAPMEYIYKIAGVIDYRKGKSKVIEYRAISNMIKEPQKDTSTSYEHKRKVVEICEEYKKKLDLLYMELRQADEDERDLIYETIKQTKEERKEKASRWLNKEYVIYLLIKEFEKEDSENWHIYAPLLECDLFQKMLKENKEKMQEVEQNPNGEFDLYGIKFAKK